MINIDKLIPYENNPRHNKDAVEVVARSIKEFGFKNPIIVDKRMTIIAGHTRLLAATLLGIKEVPIIRAEDLTDRQVKAFRIADNKTAEYATWDEELLALELSGLGDMFTGFSEDEINKATGAGDAKEDDYEINLPEEPQAQLGDIYLLGQHRLMCGDATVREDVAELMDGKIADGTITDPPYNVNYGSKKKIFDDYNYSHGNLDKIKNDNMDNESFYYFLFDFYTNIISFMKPGGAYYIFHADINSLIFRSALQAVPGCQVRQCLIWVKNALILGMQDYQWKHEPILYGWKEGAAHYFINDRCQETVIEDKIEINNLKKDELKDLLRKLLDDKMPTTIIHEDKPIINDVHPTMKPVKLIARLMQNSFRKGEIVADLFGGSGTTLMAAEQTDRICYMMEWDPKYIDVIINRWEKFTGQKAELIKRREHLHAA